MEAFALFVEEVSAVEGAEGKRRRAREVKWYMRYQNLRHFERVHGKAFLFALQQLKKDLVGE